MDLHRTNVEQHIEIDDPFPSLSDNLDHEPNLEFDDSELLNTSGNIDIAEYRCEALESPVSDGTIEENFEEELPSTLEVYPQVGSEPISILGTEDFDDGDKFAELDRRHLIEVARDDPFGRRTIIVSACRLPNSDELHPDELLRYLKHTLDRHVKQDYSIVYFHYGLNSKNKPSLSWLWQAYKTFDREYKKNLKALYLVHPTNFIRIVWQMLKPAISAKFGRKMMYVNYLHELREHLDFERIYVPEKVVQHDEELLTKNPKAAAAAQSSQHSNELTMHDNPNYVSKEPKAAVALPPTQQFGVSLQFIKENNPKMTDSIPPIVRVCIEYLSQPDALETEGIFRRSANVSIIQDWQQKCNKGEEIDFGGNPHMAAVMLKSFLRDLEEPIMTFELYEEIIQFQSWPNKAKMVKVLILEKLPMDNYKLLKYIMQFLWKVKDRSDLNKMTCSNLAIVIGPNLVWPPSGQMSLQAIAPINAFTDFLLQNQETIFII